MAKPTITTRAGKGSPLTSTEVDTNFTNIKDATLTVKAGAGGTDVVSDLNGTLTLVAGTNVTLSGDNTGKTVTINASGGSGITDLVQDTTPQLGGQLDVNGQSIVSASNGNINISPNGSGNISLTPATGKITLGALDFPTGMGTNGYVLTTNGTSAMSWAAASGGISDVVQDTTPQLGGSLDVNGQSIVSVSNGQINITPHGTGNISLAPSSGQIILGSTNYPTAMPSSGQVLTAGSAGQLTWATPSGGGTSQVILTGSTSLNFGSGDSTITTSTWTLNASGGISGVSATSTALTLPAGTYMFEHTSMYSTADGAFNIILKNVTAGTTAVSILATSNPAVTISGSSRSVAWNNIYIFTIGSSSALSFFKADAGFAFSSNYSAFSGNTLKFKFTKIA